MFNMFVVTLAPSKSHCYFFIYLPCKKYRSTKSNLTYFRNRDIVYVEVNVNKVVVKNSQGSAVTQRVLGGLAIHSPVANVLQCIYAKIMKNG